MNKKLRCEFFILFIPFLFLSNYSFCQENEKTNKNVSYVKNNLELSLNQINQMKLSFSKAGPGVLSYILTARGKIIIEPDKLAHVIPKVSGIALEAYKNIGDMVQMGDLMAILESQDLADIKASYLASISRQKLAASILEREDKLYKQKVSAGQDYLNALNIFEEASINVQLAWQKLRSFGIDENEIKKLEQGPKPDLRLYNILSPISGIITKRDITKGEFINNTTVIFEVADLSVVWVDIGIFPKDLYQVQEGQTAEIVVSSENKKAYAKLIYVSPLVSDETITAKAIAVLDNSDRTWRPGVFVNVNIQTDKVPVSIMVPKDALQISEANSYIFVRTAYGIERRVVKTGFEDSENIEITSGLTQNEFYVSTNSYILKAEFEKNNIEHQH
ncbi:Cation efflux system protein CzcB [Candidatus Rubidus massiliensis]|nr:MAG: hypothetical protein BGO10_04480 [Chlamydia sp. 32-24]CDZ80893.1 Cation efflux system protein CzcB [Candidatus Rubidus massiliensis]